MAGKIEVICGPMFSGKSEELLRRLNRATIAKRKFQLFKPKVDDRYSETEVVSHSGQRMACDVVEYAEQIMTGTEWDTKIVGIDEAQFFGLNLAHVVNSLANRGHRVIVAGLDMDSSSSPFGPMPPLLAVAESVIKLTAVCEVCGNDATHTYRKSNIAGQVLVGESEHYQARCRFHWNLAD
jgi:thymidine kinase